VPCIPQNAVYDPALFSNRVVDDVLPSVHEPRYLMIDAAAGSYRPLDEIFQACLSTYDFSDVHDWVISEDHGRAHAVLKTFWHPGVWPAAEPLDGLLDPVEVAVGKRNFLTWSMHRTLGSLAAFSSSLRAARGAMDKADLFSAFRRVVRQDARDLAPEEFSWIARKQMFRNCLEGSNRSKQGRALEARAREALRELSASGFDLEVADKESEIADALGIKHRIDLLITNAHHVLLVHMKSSQLILHGYTGIYGRETTSTTKSVREALGQGRQVSSMTLFAGRGWNGSRLPEIENPVQLPELVGIDAEAQRDVLREVFADSSLLDPFRPKTDARRAVQLHGSVGAVAPALRPAQQCFPGF